MKPVRRLRSNRRAAFASLLQAPAIALAAMLATACATGPAPVLVQPFAESEPVGSAADAADDPAIWIHPSDPAKSLVFGTDKQAGVHAYDLSGRRVQDLPIGLLNNIDLRQGLNGNTDGRDLAGASNRTDNTLTLLRIDATTGAMRELSRTPTGRIEPYGFCMGRTDAGWIAAVPYKDGVVQLFGPAPDAPSRAQAIGEWRFSGVMEGCAFDEDNGALFLAEETVGLWRVTHRGADEISRALVDSVGSSTGLKADVEGVALWRARDGGGYVIVSSQAADRYMVYDRKAPNAFRGSFRIASSADGKIDRVTHTDGIEATSTPLGEALPLGLFVAQDDANTDPAAAQNFKFVDWRAIAAALGLQ